MKYELDHSKPVRKDFVNLKECDYVFDEAKSHTCGGFSYGFGEIVLEITDDEIITADGSGEVRKWDKETREATQIPYGYYLYAFQSK